MKKSVWISMIIAGGLILAGLACIAVGHAMGGHRSLVGENIPLIATDFTPEGKFTSVAVDTLAADVSFVYAEDGVCRVEARDHQGITYTAEIVDSTLLIRAEDHRSWVDHLHYLGSPNATLTVYVPAKSLKSLSVDVTSGDVTVPRDFTFSGSVSVSAGTGDLTILSAVEGDTLMETTTGDILVEGKHKTLTAAATTGDITLRHADAKELNASVTTGSIKAQESVAITLSAVAGTGDVTLEDVIIDETIRLSSISGDHALLRVLCGGLDIRASTGDVALTETVVLGALSVDVTTGDVTFTCSDAVTLSVSTTTGDVTGSLLTSKIFATTSNSGSVEVPKSSIGGLCEIKTTSGDIRITIEE